MRQIEERIAQEKKELEKLIKRHNEVKSESSKHYFNVLIHKKSAFIEGLEEALKIIEDANKYFVE